MKPQSTNIITARYYTDNSISVTLNGRDILDVISVEKLSHESGDECIVQLTIAAAHMNILAGDAPEPSHTTQRMVAVGRRESWWSRLMGFVR